MTNLLGFSPSAHSSDALLRIGGVLSLDQGALVQIEEVAVLLAASI